MDEIVAFLAARYDEEEAEAVQARGRKSGKWEYVEGAHGQYKVIDEGGNTVSGRYDVDSDPWFALPHIARHDPARVLAEVAAKRAIIAEHGEEHECIALAGKGDESVFDGQPWELWELSNTADGGSCFVVKSLAAVYADHPYYRDEWRP